MAEAIGLAGSDMRVGRRVMSILGGSIGNLIEWYDFYAYMPMPPSRSILPAPSSRRAMQSSSSSMRPSSSGPAS